MKRVLISNNDRNSVILQCACLASCSYIEFTKTNSTDTLYINIALTLGSKKRLLNKLHKLENNFYLEKDEAMRFINTFETIKTISSNTYCKGNTYVRFENINVDKNTKYNICTLSFYNSEKNFFKNKPIYDITMTKSMVDKTIKALKELYNQE